MTYKILRSQKQKPKDVNEIALVNPMDNSLYIPSIGKSHSPNPRFKGIQYQVPAKLFHNSTDMELLKLYTKGVLKWEDTGRTCGECVNFYPDPKSRYGARCKARGFITVHASTPADERPNGWTHPIDGTQFDYWPACPYFLQKDRLSRR